MNRLASNPRFAFTFLLVTLLGWGCMEAPAHVELDVMEEPVVMTRAEFEARIVRERQAAAVEMLEVIQADPPKQCQWRDLLTVPTKKRT